MTDNRSDRMKAMNQKRAVTVSQRPKSEKAITDAERHKKELEATSAAEMWKAGMERERK